MCGKGILVPCGDERGRENENEKTKKKLWVQGLYRLRRHGGDRVLSCIKSGSSNAVWLNTTTTKVMRSSQSEWSSMNCFAPAESSHGRLMGIVIEVHDQKRKMPF